MLPPTRSAAEDRLAGFDALDDALVGRDGAKHDEVAGYFRDLRPYINHCRFPNCTHTHETNCAVKNAVADGWLDLRRYESYCQLFAGETTD
jgi:putative ribosome biogenesis GTPase RsgA